MKKISILLLFVISVLSLNAQLTVKQVFTKVNSALDVSKGFQGKAKVKTMGIGGTVSFEADGKFNCRMDDGEDIYYLNGGVSYEYDSEKNTITLEDDAESYMLVFPYMFVRSLVTGKVKWEDYKDIDVEKDKSDYVVTLKSDSGKYAFIIDSKSFLIKETKIKKGFVTLMSVTYTNLSLYKGTHSVVFDKSKYPNAKIVDKRKKK